VERLERTWADNAGSYAKEELKDKTARVARLLPQVFAWAREANPTQPLTSGVWAMDTSPDGANLGELQQIQLRESDIVTFHNYSGGIFCGVRYRG